MLYIRIYTYIGTYTQVYKYIYSYMSVHTYTYIRTRKRNSLYPMLQAALLFHIPGNPI